METILAVAAEPFELRGLTARASRSEALPWPVDFARLAEVNGRRWAMVAGGAGARLAARAAECAGRRMRVDKVVSTGFCGAVDEELEPGEVFVATRVVDADGSPVCEAGDPGARRPHSKGVLASVDRVVSSKAQRRALRERGAAVVEMEAAGVARWAQERGLPFYCVRAVTDTAKENFSIDFDAARDAEGRFQRLRICQAALRQPWRAVPELVKFAWRARRCSQALGEFLADCTF